MTKNPNVRNGPVTNENPILVRDNLEVDWQIVVHRLAMKTFIEVACANSAHSVHVTIKDADDESTVKDSVLLSHIQDVSAD